MIASWLLLGIALPLGVVAVILLVLMGVLLFEAAMFVDVLQNDRLTDTEKLLWLLGMLVIHPFVAIAYYLLKRHPY